MIENKIDFFFFSEVQKSKYLRLYFTIIWSFFFFSQREKYYYRNNIVRDTFWSLFSHRFICYITVRKKKVFVMRSILLWSLMFFWMFQNVISLTVRSVMSRNVWNERKRCFLYCFCFKIIFYVVIYNGAGAICQINADLKRFRRIRFFCFCSYVLHYFQRRIVEVIIFWNKQ